MPEAGESPPPERQTGKQLHDTFSSGQGLKETIKNSDKVKEKVQLSI